MGEGLRITASQVAVFCGYFRKVERVAGIEPARSAWEADRLPLHHTRNGFGPSAGVDANGQVASAISPFALSARIVRGAGTKEMA
jgi:hypothetical protein